MDKNNRPDLLRKVYTHAIKAVDPYHLVKRNVHLEGSTLSINKEKFNLDNYRKIHVLGAGKGAPYLYSGLQEILKGRLNGGIIVSIKNHQFRDQKVRSLAGSHPIPDEQSQKAGSAIIRYITREITPDDLVFFLLTGGASALMTAPAEKITYAEKIRINRLLLEKGAGIREINCIRKHISSLKGGRMAELIHPARIISLILSDIIDSPLEDIGSGPSIGDSSTFSQAIDILKKHGIWQQISQAFRAYFLAGKEGRVPETPEPVSKHLSHNRHFLLGDNSLALRAAREKANSLGIRSEILTSADQGEASERAQIYAGLLKKIFNHRYPYPPPVLLIAGGELTVTISGKGKGGRNQEFMLHLLKELSGVRDFFCICSLGTDGIDGPTDAAGAWIDERSDEKFKRMALNLNDFMANNDSYHFFQRMAQLIITGPTRTNVMDLRLFYLS